MAKASFSASVESTSYGNLSKCRYPRMQTVPAISFPFLCDIWEESPKRKKKKCWVPSVIHSLLHAFILYVRLCACVSAQPTRPFGRAGMEHCPSVCISPQSGLHSESFCQLLASLLEAAALGGCLSTWRVPPQQPWLCPQVGRRPPLSRQPVPWRQEKTTPDSSRTWQQIKAQRRPCPGENHPQRRVPQHC